VVFSARPARTEKRDNWEVALAYENEGQGPHLIDLSHRSRWDLQDADLSSFSPWDLSVPEVPCHCRLENGILINRMNRTQAAIWHLAGDPLEAPTGAAYTEVTDAAALLMLLGADVLSIAEKLTSLDLGRPGLEPPFLMQGPFCHVPAQVVFLGNHAGLQGLLFAFSRGYAQAMVHAVLAAGAEWDLRPAGEPVFSTWLEAGATPSDD
jgi:hypothetical protein